MSPGSALVIIHIFLSDPHVLVTWVQGDSSADVGGSRGSWTISFTIRTSRMGSVTALVASLSRSIWFTIRARRMGSRTSCV